MFDPREPLQSAKQRLKELMEPMAERMSRASEVEDIAELSAYDNHPADLASQTLAREIDMGMLLRLEERLAQLDRAETKYSEGSYGICDRCQRPIAVDRLQATPETIYCVACQSRLETEGPRSEKWPVIPKPFGRVGAAHDPVEATGGDIWQDLAEWGTSNSPQDDPLAVDGELARGGSDDREGSVEMVDTLIDENGEAILDRVQILPPGEVWRVEADPDEY